MNRYHLGDKPKITGTFTDTNGAPVDPATVTAIYTSPSGNKTTLVFGQGAEITKDAPGVYSFYIEPTEPGVWQYRMVGSGSNAVATPGSFEVLGSNV